VTRRSLAVAAVVLIAFAAVWFVSAEAGTSIAGLSRHDAVALAASFVDSSTPVTEAGSTPGPYVFLGWGLTDARPWYRMVWSVGLSGTFIGQCQPSEVNVCFPEKFATVVIDYQSGQLVRIWYGS